MRGISLIVAAMIASEHSGGDQVRKGSITKTRNRALRVKLLASGILVPANGKLKLTKDQLFSSPSQAAAVLVG